MDIQTEKIELVKLLLDTDDELILQQVKDIFENHEKDFWNDSPQYVKEGIKRGIKQAEAGELTPHVEVMKIPKVFLVILLLLTIQSFKNQSFNHYSLRYLIPTQTAIMR